MAAFKILVEVLGVFKDVSTPSDTLTCILHHQWKRTPMTSRILKIFDLLFGQLKTDIRIRQMTYVTSENSSYESHKYLRVLSYIKLNLSYLTCE